MNENFDKLQHDLDIAKRNYDISEKSLIDQKEKYDKLEKETTSKIEKAALVHKSEKQVLQEKLDEFIKSKSKL